MASYTEKVDVRRFNIPVSDVLTVFSEALNSHPELYYVYNSFSYGYSSSTGCATSYILTYDPAYSNTEQAYEAAILKALACVKDGMTDLQKALVLHDYLAEHIDYDYSLSRFNSYDALVTGSCVCQGYALAYFELLRHCGIGCEVVTSDTMQHAWNAVMLDNDWYHTDITWDDQSNSAKQGVPGKAMHTHFLASDQRMGETLNHNNWVSSHPCQSTTYDAGGFWTESKSQIVMPDAQSAYYLLGTKSSSAYGYTVTLYCRNMLTGISEALLTLDTIWKSGGSGYWQGTYSFLSYDKGLLWLNDADRVYTYSPADGQSKTVYTAPEGSQIYGFFQEAGAAVIALSNTPNSFSSVISTTITPTVRYLVTYDANGGEGVIAAQFKTAGEDLTLSLEVPTRNGYSFVGWAVDRGSREVIYRSGGSYTIDADITLYAVWKVPGDVNGDGFVGSKDFLTLMKYCAEKENLVYDPNALDIDNDGDVTANDFITLMQYIAGMDIIIH